MGWTGAKSARLWDARLRQLNDSLACGSLKSIGLKLDKATCGLEIRLV